MVKKVTTKKKLPKKRNGQVGYSVTDLRNCYLLGIKLVEKKHNLKLSKKEKVEGFKDCKNWITDYIPYNYKKNKPKK